MAEQNQYAGRPVGHGRGPDGRPTSRCKARSQRIQLKLKTIYPSQAVVGLLTARALPAEDGHRECYRFELADTTLWPVMAGTNPRGPEPG